MNNEYVVWTHTIEKKTVTSLLDHALGMWLRYSELGLNPYIETFSREVDE